jgi:hypothetical protein
MAMRESFSCPGSEVLAAFLDGRLSGEERRRVVEHLDACEDCYAVFSEAVRFQGEEEPRGRVVRSERFGTRRWVWTSVAAAAVLLVLVAVPLLRMSPQRPVVATLPGGGEAASASEALAARIEPQEGGFPADAAPWPGWGDERGLGFAGAALPPTRASFRAGVRLVDLRMAIRGENPRAARAALDGLERTLEAAGAAAAVRDELTAASEAAAAADFAALAEAANEIEDRAARLLDPHLLSFGAWVEAGRLAATLGDAAYFASPAFLATLAEVPRAALPEAAAEPLAQIEALTGGATEPPSPERLAELRTQLTRLLSDL